MNGTQKIGIGAAVLVVLGLAVVKAAKNDQAIGTVTAEKVDLPDIKSPEDVDKIEVTNGDKGTVTLEKKDDKWAITKPINVPANQANVKSLLDNMKELKATDLVEAQSNDELKKAYQLDPSKAVHVVTYKGADKKADDTFGKAGGRGQIVMTGDKPQIFTASGYSSFFYQRELKNWRDTDIFKFDDANATSATIERKDASFSFTKGSDKWSGTAKGKAIDRFDEDKVKDMIRTFKGLTADDFGDGKSPADTGLDANAATVTITLKDNAGKYVLHVGNTASGTAHYAKKDGDETIFIVGPGASDWALANTDRFQHPLDGGAPKDAGATSGMANPMGGMHGMPGMPGMPAGMPPGHP